MVHYLYIILFIILIYLFYYNTIQIDTFIDEPSKYDQDMCKYHNYQYDIVKTVNTKCLVGGCNKVLNDTGYNDLCNAKNSNYTCCAKKYNPNNKRPPLPIDNNNRTSPKSVKNTTSPVTLTTNTSSLKKISNQFPPKGYYCPNGCQLCRCKGSGIGIDSCGQLCCSKSPTPSDGTNPCYKKCPDGYTSKGGGIDWDKCFPIYNNKGINIINASYGVNCNSNNMGNLTNLLSAKCNSKQNCSYLINSSSINDPSPGCSKNFEVNYLCNALPQSKIIIDHDANGKYLYLDCNHNNKDKDWILLFRQTAGTYLSKTDWLSYNIHNPDKHNYSILSQLDESYKSKDGYFMFKLIYPLHKKPNFNIWKQKNNPVTSKKSGVESYLPININFSSNNWGGLEYNTNDKSLLDGSINSNNWYYAIGSNTKWFGGFPGPYQKEELVELYVSKPSLQEYIVEEERERKKQHGDSSISMRQTVIGVNNMGFTILLPVQFQCQ